MIEKRQLTQNQAGKIMGLPQPKVSELCNGRTETYGVERLYRFLTRVGVGVSVVLEEQPGWCTGKVEVIEHQVAKARKKSRLRRARNPSTARLGTLAPAGTVPAELPHD